MDTQKIADWLTEFESHGIYPEEMLKELEEFGITYNPDAHRLECGARTVPASIRSTKGFEAEIETRGLGGWVEDDVTGFSGHELSEAVAKLLGAVNEGRVAIGRGTRHRKAIESIRRLASG